jgi:DNA-directed RNA polymerase III subunit RPC6
MAGVPIKQKPPDDQDHRQEVASSTVADPVSLEDGILELCSKNPEGVTNEMIVEEYPGIDAGKRLKALQRLLSSGKLDLYKQSSTLLYRLKAAPSAASSKTKGFEKEERLVYQIIEDAGNKGIWIRDIRIQSNLSQTQVNKVLKVLESKKLIKAVKSVQASKKKVYMLFDLTPDESITGGAWYSDQDFETEFVDILNQHCLRFLQQKMFKATRNHSDPLTQREASCASVAEVWKFITELGISRVSLTMDNIETILNTLIYDGKAEMSVVVGESVSTKPKEGDGLVKQYRAVKSHVSLAGLEHIPCGVCPVFSSCHDDGPVSPSKCQYMKEWLQF